MPSLHVAIACLIALLLRGYPATLRIAGWAFAIVTLLGSVLLGWHYAIDGYAAIGLVLIVWWIAGVIQAASLRITDVC